MKNNVKWFLTTIVLMAFCLLGCDEEDANVEAISEWEVSESALNLPQDNFEFKLDREDKDNIIRFEWAEATADRNYLITYNWIFDLEDGDFSNPLMRQSSASGGTELFAEISYAKLDESLANAGVAENAKVNVKWAVESIATVKRALSSRKMTLQRFGTPPKPPTSTPDNLFLFIDGALEAELIKEGAKFRYEFIDLDPAKKYTLNDKSDASGNVYAFAGAVGTTTSENDKEVGTVAITEGDSAIKVSKKQAYRFLLDFDTNEATWEYYNFKLFHWDDWEQRQEIVMTYVGGYTWEITSDLNSGFNSKFITPWDFQFGGAETNVLSGNLNAGDGGDMNNIVDPGAYKVQMALEKDFSTGTYSFTKQ